MTVNRAAMRQQMHADTERLRGQGYEGPGLTLQLIMLRSQRDARQVEWRKRCKAAYAKRRPRRRRGEGLVA